MEPKTETRRYWILRFWRLKDNLTRYAADTERYHSKRSWYAEKSRSEAYKFMSRSDARQAVRAKSFEELVKGRRTDAWGRDRKRIGEYYTSTIFNWEIVKVVETITTTFEEETEVSNAPAMVQIARACL